MAEPAPGVALRICPPRGRIDLRGDPADPAFPAAVSSVLGLELPSTPNTSRSAGAATVLWLGPDAWLIETERAMEAEVAETLKQALPDLHCSVAAVGDGSVAVSVSGPRAADVLAKGMTLDLDPARFRAGHCARSLLARIPVLLHRPGDDVIYEVTAARSYSEYALDWLHDAALEYGDAAGSS